MVEKWSVERLIENCTSPIYRNYEEFLSFKELVQKPLIIYGAGYFGRQLFYWCAQYDIPVAAVCDSYLAGQNIPGIGKIRAFEEVAAQISDYQVAIASLPHRNEIERRIRKTAPECEILFFTFPLITITHRHPPQIYRGFLKENSNKLEKLMHKLEDELSRKTLDAVLRARLTWDAAYLQDIYNSKQYFPEFVKLGNDEVFFDCGAWIGDTLGAWIEETGGKFQKVVCYEPEKAQANKLISNFEKEIEEGRVELISKCLSDKEGTVYLCVSTSATGSYIVNSTSGYSVVQVQTTTIDCVAKDEPDVTFIKMDIEGSELAALKGAEQTIRRCRPKLAICVYHKMEDIIEIPQYIDGLDLNYR